MVSSFFFSHNAPTFVTGISMQSLGDSNNLNVSSSFLHGVTNCRTVSTRFLGHSGDRLKPLEASRYLPVLFNLSISLLKALVLAIAVLPFLKMSPNPAVTFLSTFYSNRS